MAICGFHGDDHHVLVLLFGPASALIVGVFPLSVCVSLISVGFCYLVISIYTSLISVFSYPVTFFKDYLCLSPVCLPLVKADFERFFIIIIINSNNKLLNYL